MIISVYELLGLIKDDKAPKKIHHQYYEYNWNGIDKDYQKNTGDTLLGNINIQHHLNDKVEILEKDKPIIEKLYIGKNDITYDDGVIRDDELVDSVIDIKDKINEIIEYINSNLQK